MTTPAHERLLVSQEAADYLSTTPRHLRRLISEHGLPVVQLGGRRRFRREDLDRFVSSRVVGATMPAEAVGS